MPPSLRAWLQNLLILRYPTSRDTNRPQQGRCFSKVYPSLAMDRDEGLFQIGHTAGPSSRRCKGRLSGPIQDLCYKIDIRVLIMADIESGREYCWIAVYPISSSQSQFNRLEAVSLSKPQNTTSWQVTCGRYHLSI